MQSTKGKKWHPKLAEKMKENRYNPRTLAEPLYHCRETVDGWLRNPERVPVVDAIRICKLLNIPLAEIEDYFTNAKENQK